MKITLQQLNQSYNALKELSQTKLPARLAYKISKMWEACDSEAKRLQTKVNNLIVEYGEDEGDGKFAIKAKHKEKMEQFQKEYADLLQTEFEFWGEPIPFKLIEDLNIEISGEALIVLDWLFTFEEEVK